MAMIKPFDLATSLQICEKLELAPRYSRLLCQQRIQAQNQLMEMERRPPRSALELVSWFKSYRTELILFMMAATSQNHVKKDISHYHNHLRKIQPLINGQDLIAWA